MLRIVDAVLRYLIPVQSPFIQMKPAIQFAGGTPQQRTWFRKKGVLWFNGYPGLPKLPLVQRRRATPSSLNAVVSDAPEAVEGDEEAEDPEPLCRKSH